MAYRSARRVGKIEANLRDGIADDDGLGVSDASPVDMDGVPAAGEAVERRTEAALEGLAWGARADRFADGQRDHVPHAQRRAAGKDCRPRACDGVKIEGHPDAYHDPRVLGEFRGAACCRGVTTLRMPVFGKSCRTDIVEAAERFIAKMDERALARALAQSEPTLPPDSRAALLEAIFDAFRRRGESSEDAVEAAGTTLDGIDRGEAPAIAALLRYAGDNPGLLREATVALVEREPDLIARLPRDVIDGISRRLREP